MVLDKQQINFLETVPPEKRAIIEEFKMRYKEMGLDMGIHESYQFSEDENVFIVASPDTIRDEDLVQINDLMSDTFPGCTILDYIDGAHAVSLTFSRQGDKITSTSSVVMYDSTLSVIPTNLRESSIPVFDINYMAVDPTLRGQRIGTKSTYLRTNLAIPSMISAYRAKVGNPNVLSDGMIQTTVENPQWRQAFKRNVLVEFPDSSLDIVPYDQSDWTENEVRVKFGLFEGDNIYGLSDQERFVYTYATYMQDGEMVNTIQRVMFWGVDAAQIQQDVYNELMNQDNFHQEDLITVYGYQQNTPWVGRESKDNPTLQTEAFNKCGLPIIDMRDISEEELLEKLLAEKPSHPVIILFPEIKQYPVAFQYHFKE
ncbi:hypothetical protein A2X44_04595 [candidate division CPR3 bacterium GWF2_35_18]|uniref:Uncharacterized protein n=1 Tax=candidate division CPR3 bacterium GW2011_GWF2_35_18 TaxID=1618350 RepID=A0A0G0BJW9_UNCC3|nr:MAG: hypothetical protein UR67_C0003G0001 [candidate division CPR3 bacterium GW2011_GWF2_35_18]OGB63613.1 MAG: hypothetical protein A2X44_04595 [candidate division CPR3 bacterium GWF2_35_18]OGB64192.1 MAG: hypothetical protein A2250_02650 [candidate division CPR3 bacterium RIFOXYA2_FULL_35_13]OGB76816.1 MAG: hypothetical protein A2476_05035 [candidate division CPR3 bacterium RIFOXYC2_FULL_35_7]OGB78395.1 MAG: hypothetical protein A2296_02845 [candidate division CPR3 bacterium RIFOXYB2_FULL_3